MKIIFKSILYILICWQSCTLYAQAIDGGNMNAVASLQIAQQRADEAYKNGDYKLAFRRYQKLAEVGDKFAQFRLAVMYEDGLHVEQSLIEAYAWSYVAAESDRKEFRDYNARIKQLLNEEELATARKHAGNRVTEFGLYKQASDAYKLLLGTIRSCTGSRVGNTCASVKVIDMTCSIASDELPGQNCLRIGTMGLESIVGNFPLTVRKAKENLQNFMDAYNPGRVELGDFELIDDPPKAADNN
ncbi:MAG: hypothetical protein PF630_11135 [Gammaproteobacteria bacterium]|jgi:hypothetical protein|nr:hypothetical protein [Gammaproteobacteria bacterium]